MRTDLVYFSCPNIDCSSFGDAGAIEVYAEGEYEGDPLYDDHGRCGGCDSMLIPTDRFEERLKEIKSA